MEKLIVNLKHYISTLNQASFLSLHYCDIIMGVISSQITSLVIVYPIIHLMVISLVNQFT